MNLRELSYTRIAEALQQEAAAQKTLAYSRLPSERELAELYSCSRVTIRKALDVLEERGCISRVKGQGTFWVETVTDLPKVVCKEKSWRIAIVLFNFGMTGILDFVNGIEHATEWNRNYQYSFWHIDAEHNDKVEHFQKLAENDGFIVVGDFRLAELSWFISSRKPLVVVGQASDHAILSMPSRPFSFVKIDVVRGWEMAAEQLFHEGYRFPAICVASQHQAYKERRDGVLQAMRRAGIPEENCFFHMADETTDHGLLDANKLYSGAERLWQNSAKFDCLLTTLEPVLILVAAQRHGFNMNALCPIIAECNHHDLTPRFLGVNTLVNDDYAIGVQTMNCLLKLLDGTSGYDVINICPVITKWHQ